MGRIEEHEETEVYRVAEPLAAEELSKQMKQQLELLKTGKRSLSLIEETTAIAEVPPKKPKQFPDITEEARVINDSDDRLDAAPSKQITIL